MHRLMVAMTCHRLVPVFVLLTTSSSAAATLERMSLEDLAGQSTSIIRGQAGQTRVTRQGALLYTISRVEVLRQWKGDPVDSVEVALPGGQLGELRQRFGGVPQLRPGREYVLFLWRGPSGLTQVTGLSQGVLDLERSAEGEWIVSREPSAEVTLIPTGISAEIPNGEAPAENETIRMPLRELAGRIRQILQAEPDGS